MFLLRNSFSSFETFPKEGNKLQSLREGPGQLRAEKKHLQTSRMFHPRSSGLPTPAPPHLPHLPNSLMKTVAVKTKFSCII